MSTKMKSEVRNVMYRIIQKLEKEESEGRKDTALLAAFRNSAGKSFRDAEDVWPFLLENLPEDFLSTDGQSTREENAVFVTLQLYAICKQGSSKTVKTEDDFAYNMGRSLGYGRTAEQAKALDRRFNAMITAADFDEFTYHLRQLVRLEKAKSGLQINYPLLAEDLYWYQRGQKDRVCLKWATSYYGSGKLEQEKTGEEEINE